MVFAHCGFCRGCSLPLVFRHCAGKSGIGIYRNYKTRGRITKTISIRDRMYSVIAHDLRSPLCRYSQSAYLLREMNERNLAVKRGYDVFGIDYRSLLPAHFGQFARMDARSTGKSAVQFKQWWCLPESTAFSGLCEHIFHKKRLPSRSIFHLDVLVVVDKPLCYIMVLRNLLSAMRVNSLLSAHDYTGKQKIIMMGRWRFHCRHG